MTAGPPDAGAAPAEGARRFAGQVAVVTGAASGIGRALATALAAEGATVVLADVDGVGARQVAEGLGEPAESATLDVTDAAAVQALVAGVAERHGRLDLLCNNAGIGAGGPAQQLAVEDWRRVIDVDLHSVVYGVAAAYPLMVRQGSGHIVNTASLAGLVPSPLLTPYATAKAGVVGLSLSLRVEAAAYGVGVTVVCPGPVETPLLDQSGPADPGNPADPTSPRSPVNVRKLLTNALGEPYPAEAMAADILDGVAENRAVVVAPPSAEAAWRQFRQDPEELLAVMAGQAVASRERREQGT